MFPSALAIPAVIPLALDLTAAFGPVLLLAVLALLDLSAVAVLHAALVSRRSSLAMGDAPKKLNRGPLRPRRSDPQTSTPPARAA